MIAILIVVLAVVFAFYVAWRHSPARAMLNVYLPLLIIIPSDCGIMTHGVLVHPATAASLPILILTFLQPHFRWTWRWTDLLLVAYMLEGFYGEYRIGHDFSFAGADAVTSGIIVVPSYFFGRYLIEEKDVRIAFIKRLVFMLFVISCLSLFEYRMGVNPFAVFFSALFSVPFTFLQQFRWGFARVGGPFGHAILAGIVMTTGLLLQLWLSSNGYWEKKFRRARWLPGKKTTYITVGLLAGLWMTQSRGPWMGGALGFLLYLASRAKKIRKGITKAVILSVMVFAAFYVATDKYTDPGTGPMTQDQENAVYRRNLLTNYMPLVNAGGVFGFGRYFPTIDGQGSIDNYYLLTALLSGYAGLGLFASLILATVLKLLHLAWVSRNREDAGFALCLLGIAVGTAVTLTTVYLGAQTFALFFFICGWAQALKPRGGASLAMPETATELQPMQRFAYRRVFS
jgi:hypothetical protein